MPPKWPLRIPAGIYADLLAHARAELPNECVGMLAGTTDGVVTRRYPLVNQLADPRRFESAPHSMFRAERQRRLDGVEFLAVYHSHPSSEPVPSKFDLAQHYGEETMCVIVSLAAAVPQVRGYWIREGRFDEGQIKIKSGDPRIPSS
jgi:proteasome lid subunit RPN8/RPN11